MRTNRKEAASILPIIGEDVGGTASGSRWIPTPRMRRAGLSMRTSNLRSVSDARDPAVHCPSSSTDQVVVLSGAINGNAGHHSSPCSAEGTRLGFAAPDDRLTSLSVPAEGAYGQSHATLSFDLEFDLEEPDQITISLMDLDEDNFIRTVHRTVRFPARLVAELLSRRKATAEEVETWKAPEIGE